MMALCRGEGIHRFELAIGIGRAPARNRFSIAGEMIGEMVRKNE
jgi:hypothetical protein